MKMNHRVDFLSERFCGTESGFNQKNLTTVFRIEIILLSLLQEMHLHVNAAFVVIYITKNKFCFLFNQMN